MTNHVQESPVVHTIDAPQPARPEVDVSRSVRTGSIVAGTGILLMAALAAVGQLVVIEGLVTQGDAARTAEDILASEGMFRFGVATWYLVAILDVVVAWGLLQVFSPVDRGIARLAAWSRLAYAAVLTVAVSQLAGVPSLVRSEDYSSAFSEKQLHAQAMLKVDAFNDTWTAALILFGVHLLLIGYLALRSGYVPKVLGILLVIAGAGYVFDSFGTVLSQGSPLIVSTVTFLGEFLLACWLVIRGRRVSLGTSDVKGDRVA
jgi:hypothetical protein